MTLRWVNGYFDARYIAPEVWPLLPTMGRQITDRCTLSDASARKRESDATSLKQSLSLEFNTGQS